MSRASEEKGDAANLVSNESIKLVFAGEETALTRDIAAKRAEAATKRDDAVSKRATAGEKRRAAGNEPPTRYNQEGLRWQVGKLKAAIVTLDATSEAKKEAYTTSLVTLVGTPQGEAKAKAAEYLTTAAAAMEGGEGGRGGGGGRGGPCFARLPEPVQAFVEPWIEARAAEKRIPELESQAEALETEATALYAEATRLNEAAAALDGEVEGQDKRFLAILLCGSVAVVLLQGLSIAEGTSSSTSTIRALQCICVTSVIILLVGEIRKKDAVIEGMREVVAVRDASISELEAAAEAARLYALPEAVAARAVAARAEAAEAVRQKAIRERAARQKAVAARVEAAARQKAKHTGHWVRHMH
jgi:hypothetical protein